MVNDGITLAYHFWTQSLNSESLQEGIADAFHCVKTTPTEDLEKSDQQTGGVQKEDKGKKQLLKMQESSTRQTPKTMVQEIQMPKPCQTDTMKKCTKKGTKEARFW